MKRTSAVLLLLLIAFLGLRQEKAYSFAECPAMVLGAQAPMSCCPTGACHCQMEKAPQSNPSEFITFSGNDGVDAAFIKTSNFRVRTAPAIHAKADRVSSERSPSSKDKLYELYSDYRI